jgi:beta-galactosidase
MHIKIIMKYAVLYLILPGVSPLQAQKNIAQPHIVTAELWNDSRGEPINAHGGGVLFHKGKFDKIKKPPRAANKKYTNEN